MRVTSLILAVSLILAPSLAAQVAECTDASFMGVYGLHSSGAFRSGTSNWLLASVGRLQSYGDQTGIMTEVISSNGTIIRRTATVGYLVNTDCTLSVTIRYPDGSVTGMEGTLVDNGREALLIQTEPAGAAVVSSFRKVGGLAVNGCTTGDLRGTYGMTTPGAGEILSGSGAGPFAVVSTIYADGEGGFTQTQIAIRGGLLQRSVTAGTYQMAADCTGTLSFGSGASQQAADFVLVDDSNEIRLLTTDDGAVTPAFLVRRVRR